MNQARAMTQGLIGYYIYIAMRNMRERWTVAVLMVGTLAIGVGGTVSAFALIRAASADPVPAISRDLGFPVLETGPLRTRGPKPSTLWAYGDYRSLTQSALQGFSYAATYMLYPAIGLPGGVRPKRVLGHAVTPGFLSMVEAPLSSGSAWGEAAADARGSVVISRGLSKRLFGGKDAVGNLIDLDGHAFRVTGVLGDFHPSPKFYDLDGGAFEAADEFFVDLSSALDAGLMPAGNVRCQDALPADSKALASSGCRWVSVLVRNNDGRFRGMQEWLANFARYRFDHGVDHDRASTAIYGMDTWLKLQGAVPDNAVQLQLICLGILVVSCANLVALLLSSFLRKERDLGVRRALGASRGDIVMQLVTESCLVGALSGLLGTVFAIGGTALIREYVPATLAALVKVDLVLLLVAVFIGCFTAVCAGIYPALRAATVNPALQVKQE